MDDMSDGPLHRYKGNWRPKDNEKDENGRPLYGYLPDEALIEAVNLAIYLKRPLLLKGEPGCGKTRLARAVAYELGLPYEAWHVKSTSRARDGLYIYDTVGRLRDAQLTTISNMRSSNNPANYVRWEALGRAFRNRQRTVVLIDEIDKADIDFPNDLLLELDEQRFLVEETGQEIRAKEDAEPIVFITSNDEKDLPDAFLRRCLFHYIKFPDEKRLAEIVKAHYPKALPTIVDAAVRRFLELRKKMEEDKGEAGKRVSTSELIDWFRVLHLQPEQEMLAKLQPDGDLPYASVLLKSLDDQRYREREQMH